MAHSTSCALRIDFHPETRKRETGFYQGGKVQFGYTPERRTINGKTGSVLVPSENAEAVRVAYDLYQHPENSLTDVIRHITESGINATRPEPRSKLEFWRN